MNDSPVRAIAKAAVELTSRHQKEDVFDTMLRELHRIVPFDVATVLSLEDGKLWVTSEQGLKLGLDKKELSFKIGENPRLDRALKANGVVQFDNPLEADPFDGLTAFPTPSLHSCMAAPMRIGRDVLGVITADAYEEGCFAAHHAELLELFGTLAAVAARNAKLVGELKEAKARLQGEVDILSQEIQGGNREPELIGRSRAICELREEIAFVAPTQTPVLIMGETGTGKELVARAIHGASLRRHRPLIRFDASAVAPTLVESELYGHVRGAFTGAVSSQAGKFEVANQGTLFLDEIGELPLAIQPRLLRALQEKEIERVGEHRVRHFDTRILAATNRDLMKEVAEGRFRADLFHRLAVYPIRVPSLAERLEDIPELARHFARRMAARLQLEELKLQDDFLFELQKYTWPGNVRELENTVERALVRKRGMGRRVLHLDAHDARSLGLMDRAPSRRLERPKALRGGFPKDLTQATHEFQLQLIEQAIDHAGSLSKAAGLLGEDRSNLHRKLKRLREKLVK